MTLRVTLAALLLGLLCAVPTTAADPAAAPGVAPLLVSGRYPHLSMFNTQGECGVGAVVPWANKLWVITYAPHKPEGSDDKLYEIGDDLSLTIRAESVGGTPANRMIHRESKQLIIGPYFIDEAGKVRVITPKQMPGRLTATARHLQEPESKVYIYDMEGTLYEVDVKTLAVKQLFKRAVPGWHGKGAYSSQSRLVVANNGELPAFKFDASKYLAGTDSKGPDEAGVLAEWDGTTWKIVERKQFTEVTGPGGIYGQPNNESPLWSMGWDRRSVILKVLEGGQWYTLRLPKGSYCYDGRHGWHTEWPRIREAAPGKLLAYMHGLLYELPTDFSVKKPGGLAPVGNYLKIFGDLSPWKDKLVFGCDDVSMFNNALAGQSHSNLWFTSLADLKKLGQPTGWGGVWVRDAVAANVPSDAFLCGGFVQRGVHLSHDHDAEVSFTLEIDAAGDGQWTPHHKVTVPARGYAHYELPADLNARWIRVVANQNLREGTAYFHFGPSQGAVTTPELFASLADVNSNELRTAGVVRPRGENLGTLSLLATPAAGTQAKGEATLWEVDPQLQFHARADGKDLAWMQDKATVKKLDFDVDAASVIVREANGKRYRLPKGDAAYEHASEIGWPRGIREVVTERALFQCQGTFYVLPRENSGGWSRIKPICTHNKAINDFCSWRGLLVLTGAKVGAQPDGHYFASADKQTGAWFGDYDDLWQMGKPRGHGGPWSDTVVEAGKPSDPFLMTGFDKKSVQLSHRAAQPVALTLEVDFLGDGTWHKYATLNVAADQPLTHAFPAGFSAHWVRVSADQPCTATVQFKYE